MKKLKVMTVVGTRPEIIRLSRVMAKLDEHTDHVIVHTGQNYDYELSEIFFEELGIRRPDHFLNAAGISSSETIGKVIIAVDSLLSEVKPDALLVLGDTNSCMAALPAKRHKVPVFHMEAGNRCFDQRVPEEINRRIVDHMADVNLTYSSIAREYLLREGLPADMVIKTGSPMNEVLSHFKKDIMDSAVLSKLELEKSGYFLLSLHREENIEPELNFDRIVEIINGLVKHYAVPIIFSTHPRTMKKIEAKKIEFDPLVRLLKPLGFIDYNHLQINAKAVLSDSGTISEESSILNFPALNIRETHERPEAMEEASVMMTGLDINTVFQSLAILESQKRGEERTIFPVDDYGIPNVSDKVVRIIQSYTGYVNRKVWMKP
ncbi:MAG: UDP-N-acetylglucosamine 2-epimerase (non-hydrolyzing) [Pseudohongiella sp.]|nr:UDP-N-acetylglucosamine 2-epimerase (non-hydrolyzing) [Pseudohongiella sp.]